jgi:hypothetical protein
VIRDGYVARWRGQEYEASPDGDDVRLYRPDPAEGFVEVRPGRYRRILRAAELDDLVYVRTVCIWRGEPFIVLARHEGWLRVEYTGGRWPVAQALGLEEFDFGVYQGWAPAVEVTDLREHQF